MEDIFLDGPRQQSAQNISRKQKEKKKNGRRLREYLVDLFVKSLLLAALLGIDFTLFAEAGSYNLFTAEQTLATEAMWIYAGIAIFSFAVIFLFSFSLTLQNLIIGIGGGFLLLAMFAQFALFDSHSFLATYFNNVQIAGISDILANYSHLASALILVVFISIFLTFAKRSTQTYLLGILVLILGGLMSEAYFNPKSRVFDTLASLGEESSHPNGHNLVFISLQNAPSYYQLSSFSKQPKDSVIEQSLNNILGFYQQNNFTYYPYAYVRYSNNPYLNMVSSLNPDTTKDPEQLLLSDVIMTSYWDFKNLGNSKLYLKDNQVFDSFTKDDYNIRVYEGAGIELCSINSRLSVNRCIRRTGLPISFDDLDISAQQKAALLAAEWLESTSLIKGIDPILGLTSAFTREISPLHFSTKQLKSYDAFKNLNLIAQDIATDRGNNVYVTVLDMPGHLFMYDNLCKIKPVSEWVSSQDSSTSLVKRREAFAEQTSCLYGQLENFIQKLERNSKLEHTTIIIAGLNTPFPSIPGVEKDLFKNLQNTKQTGIAIYDPAKNQADMDYSLCTVPSILGEYLYKKDCTELEDVTITDQLKAQLFKEAKKQELSNEQTEEAKKAFKQWYASWAAYHQVENNMAEGVIPLEKSPDTPEILPEKEIKAAPVASEAEELAPEAEVKTLQEIEKEIPAAEETLKETSETKPQNEPQTPKQPEKEITPPAAPIEEASTATKVKEKKTVVKEETKKPEEITAKETKAETQPAKEEEVKPKVQPVKAETKTVPQQQEQQAAPVQTVKEKAKAPVPEKKPEQAQPKTTVQKATAKATVAEAKPLPKPERLKQEFRKKMAAAQEKMAATEEDKQKNVIVEVKVIEQSSGTDVIPPALIDDLAEEPSSISQPQR